MTKWNEKLGNDTKLRCIVGIKWNLTRATETYEIGNIIGFRFQEDLENHTQESELLENVNYGCVQISLHHSVTMHYDASAGKDIHERATSNDCGTLSTRSASAKTLKFDKYWAANGKTTTVCTQSHLQPR